MKPVLVQKSHDYRIGMLQSVVTKCMQGNAVREPALIHIPKHIAPVSPPSKDELIRRHMSR